MTSKIIRGAKITPPDPARTETVTPTATAYKILSGTSLGGVLKVSEENNISDYVGVVGTISTGDNKTTTIEGLGANPGFIIHNLVPRAIKESTEINPSPKQGGNLNE